eukprot:GHRR01003017.1.p1 GENE.GHRR01003017.1~~GHRR01003017.1.p1  ORF type:complete len:246 (+),score=16.37 GHRR01003017.1:28-765(+)
MCLNSSKQLIKCTLGLSMLAYVPWEAALHGVYSGRPVSTLPISLSLPLAMRTTMRQYGALLAIFVVLTLLRPSLAQVPSGPAIPASANVTQLNEFTFQGRISDGKVWFVEFYADWCRGCRRIAGHVSMLADDLAATHPQIVVARLDCDKAERFCNEVIRIERTPVFKVYHQGKYAITYKSDFHFVDLMKPFITNVASEVLGKSLGPPPPQQRQQQQQQVKSVATAAEAKSAAEDDDDYDDAVLIV